MNLKALGLLLALPLSACVGDGGDAGAADSAAADTIGTTLPAAEFARLSFLEGAWRGRAPDGRVFYERYATVDDTTIRMIGFGADSTFGQPVDSATIRYLGGRIVFQNPGGRWVAVASDAAGLHFAPVAGPHNFFSWRSVSPDRWQATIRLPIAEGDTNRLVYPLERVTPSG